MTDSALQLCSLCDRMLPLDHSHKYPLPEGTKRLREGGYVDLKVEGGWQKEHTYVMEEALGRELFPDESVHHRNGIRHDNRLENLELWVGGIRYGQRAHEILCENCGHPWAAQPWKDT